MKRLTWTCLAMAAAVGMAGGAVSAVPPMARIDTGTLAGRTAGPVDQFLGIPFAAAPVGALRWRAPQAAVPWSGTRTATAYGHDCMQTPFPSDAAPLGTEPSEDCLVANVWRPVGAKDGAGLPVMVWIYGGGSVNGGASPAVYAGDAFARDGVVMVSFNWRVGRFGFFSHPALANENADGGLRANYGYMDVLAALKWVKRNVAAFGGDPSKVTIYGQSAGASVVAMLLSTPLATGLFQRAIIQSGGGTAVEPTAYEVGAGASPPIEQAGINLAREHGIADTDADALAKLRALPADQVNGGLHMGTRAAQAATYAGPVMDGKLLTGSLMKAVDAAAVARVPIIVGATTADNFALMRAKTLDEAFSTTFAPNQAQARAAYLAEPNDAPQHILREMGRDMAYNEPARRLATKLRMQAVPVYIYRFGYVADSMRGEWQEGPPHATDIPFAMETITAKYGDRATPTDVAVAQTLHGYWVNFVKRGNPNGAGLPNWPAFDPATDMLMVVSPDGKAQAVADPYQARLDAVEAARKR